MGRLIRLPAAAARRARAAAATILSLPARAGRALLRASRDLTLLASVAAIAVGCGLAWLPAGFIAGGAQGLALLWMESKGRGVGTH